MRHIYQLYYRSKALATSFSILSREVLKRSYANSCEQTALKIQVFHPIGG